MITRYSMVLQAIVPGNSPVIEVLDGGRSDAFIDILIGAFVGKAKVTRKPPKQPVRLRLLAEQLRFEDSVPFFLPVSESHTFTRSNNASKAPFSGLCTTCRVGHTRACGRPLFDDVN